MDFDIFDEIQQLFDSNEFEKAIQLINSSDELQYNPQLKILLSHAYSCAGDNLKAIEILKSMENETDSNDIGYHYELGWCYFFSGRYESAINEINKCLEIDETISDAHIMMCNIALETENIDVFNEHSEYLKEHDPESWSYYISMLQMNHSISYTEEQSDRIIQFLRSAFGKESDVVIAAEPGLKIYVFPPTDKLYFNKIVSVGIGCCSPDKNKKRTELVFYLPADWNVQSHSPDDFWPFSLMILIMDMLISQESYIDYGHTFSNGKSFASSVGFNSIIMDYLHYPFSDNCECTIDDEHSDIVQFLQAIPLYEEETVFKMVYGADALLDRLRSLLGSKSAYCIVDPKRENTCIEFYEKKYAIPKSCIVSILEWKGADGCFATDRIMIDHKPVGYMYREKPVNDFDSGWRFLAGDEDEQYMNDTSKQGIYKLNTLCNYDITIADYLDKPVGSAFYRNSKGKFIPSSHV